MARHTRYGFALLSATLCAGLSLAACGGGGGGASSILAPVIQATMRDATQADLSGQASAFQGTLRTGAAATFAAVTDATYTITINTTDADDEVTFRIIDMNGQILDSRNVDSGFSHTYVHTDINEHVLLTVTPRNPLELDIEVTSLTISGIGSFSGSDVHINAFVVGDFAGYGQFNDLTTNADKGAFTDAVMQRVQQLFIQTGIAISYEGFAYTAAQVRAIDAGLVDSSDRALCGAIEQVNLQNFSSVDLRDLNRWARFGFAANDPDYRRGHGINLFFINHFVQEGKVGFSPRPGVLAGNGDAAAMASSAFLQFNGQFFPRNVDQVALVTAHEIGHFLGLRHTTDFSPSPTPNAEPIDDGINDTPACVNPMDVNGDGFVGIGDGCPDESNIMFYQVDNQSTFSADQGRVMRNMLSVQEH